MTIMSQLAKHGIIDTSVKRVDGTTLAEAIDKYATDGANFGAEAEKMWKSAPGNRYNITLGSQENYYDALDTDRASGWMAAW